MVKSYLLITVDCLRKDHVGAYGYNRNTTPNIDSLASNGTCYKYSYSNSPGTAWALQTLFSGIHTHQFDGFGLTEPNNNGLIIPSFFQEEGFKTGGFVNNGWLSRDYNYHSYFDEFYGVSDYLDETESILKWGKMIDKYINNYRFRKYIARPVYETIQRYREGADSNYREGVVDADICDDAIDWIITQQQDDQPYFAWVHLMDAHSPWSRWNNHLEDITGSSDIPHIIDAKNKITQGESPPQEVIDTYDASIRSCDKQVGRLLSTISDETVVILTGDHGEEFGSYGPYHRTSLYSSMTRVPLIIRSPSIESGSIDTYPVQHLDIAPTLADLLGRNPHKMWRGDSLVDIDRSIDHEIYFTLGTSNPRRGIREEKWKYINSKNRESKLFCDGHESHDTTDVKTEYPNKKKELQNKLEDLENVIKNQRVSGDMKKGTDGLSDSVEKNLEDLGYLD